MGDQQESARQRGGDGREHQRAGTRFAGDGKPGDDNRRRQELQHRRGGGVGLLDSHQEGVLHGERAEQRKDQQTDGVFAVLQDAENLIAVKEREHQKDQAGEQQARHGQKRR